MGLNAIAACLIALIVLLAAFAVANATGGATVHEAPWWVDIFLKLLDALVRILQVVVWPFVVICIVRLFRPHLGSFFENLKSGKVSFPGGSVEVDLEKAREKLDEDMKNSGTKITDEQIDEEDAQQERAFNRLVQEVPAAAIVGSYVLVELALRDAFDRYSAITNRPAVVSFITQKSLLRITRELESAGAISPELSAVLSRLRKLRNEAAHSQDFSITADEAREYRAIASGAAIQISALFPQVTSQPSSAPL